MKPESIPTPLRHLLVALVFGTCGALSAANLLVTRSGAFPDQPAIMLPVPFILLCALLFLRTVRIILAAPLMIAV